MLNHAQIIHHLIIFLNILRISTKTAMHNRVPLTYLTTPVLKTMMIYSAQKITEEKIPTCINQLNNGKSPGNDHILNEHIKSGKHLFMQLHTCLFNGILDSGIKPDSWLVGNICPIYKNKGDSLLPENYRPITILSCLGKLFTSVINQRLVRYLNENDLLSETQTGFRKTTQL